jgi:hypothetical protein
LEIPDDILGNVVNILHGIHGRDLVFVVACIPDTPQIPCKMLSGFQTGNMLAMVGF